ncbi:MAG: hypothetical protein ACI4JZ_07130 [Oscillospiraceae bacterium]
MNENNSFKEIIDKIEPEDGARERMLNNIKRKAAEQQAAQKPAKKSSAFAKIARWALPAAACLAIAVVGFNVVPRLVSPPVESGGVEIPNPFMMVNSADDFEQKLSLRADAPAGSEDIAYSILDGSIAQVDFIYGGKSYTLRASNQSGDFSGINGTLIKSDKIDAQTDAVLETIRGIDYNYFKLKWTNGAVTFILSNRDETTAESITEIYQKIK